MQKIVTNIIDGRPPQEGVPAAAFIGILVGPPASGLGAVAEDVVKQFTGRAGSGTEAAAAGAAGLTDYLTGLFQSKVEETVAEGAEGTVEESTEECLPN